jgi:hypothetical protein
LPRVLVKIDGGLDWKIGFIYHLHVVTLNNYYTIADFHTTNHSTLSLLNLFTSLYLVTAIHSGYSSAVSSLDVSWQRILAMEILQLPLPPGYHSIGVPSTPCRQSQSQSDFMTGSLPPISLSWHQAP